MFLTPRGTSFHSFCSWIFNFKRTIICICPTLEHPGPKWTYQTHKIPSCKSSQYFEKYIKLKSSHTLGHFCTGLFKCCLTFKVAPICFAFSWATELYKRLSCASWWISASSCQVMLQQLLTSQFLYCHHKFCFHGNYTEAQIHPIFTIRLHFTQKAVGELPFLLHQNCLHIKEHFLRKFKKILSRGFCATLILKNIKVAPKLLDRIF